MYSTLIRVPAIRARPPQVPGVFTIKSAKLTGTGAAEERGVSVGVTVGSILPWYRVLASSGNGLQLLGHGLCSSLPGALSTPGVDMRATLQHPYCLTPEPRVTLQCVKTQRHAC